MFFTSRILMTSDADSAIMVFNLEYIHHSDFVKESEGRQILTLISTMWPDTLDLWF